MTRRIRRRRGGRTATKATATAATMTAIKIRKKRFVKMAV